MPFLFAHSQKRLSSRCARTCDGSTAIEECIFTSLISMNYDCLFRSDSAHSLLLLNDSTFESKAEWTVNFSQSARMNPINSFENFAYNLIRFSNDQHYVIRERFWDVLKIRKFAKRANADIYLRELGRRNYNLCRCFCVSYIWPPNTTFVSSNVPRIFTLLPSPSRIFALRGNTNLSCASTLS